jgi:hypothetical protein
MLKMSERTKPKMVSVTCGEVDPERYDDWTNNGPYLAAVGEDGSLWIYWIGSGIWEETF